MALYSSPSLPPPMVMTPVYHHIPSPYTPTIIAQQSPAASYYAPMQLMSSDQPSVIVSPPREPRPAYGYRRSACDDCCNECCLCCGNFFASLCIFFCCCGQGSDGCCC